MTFFARLALVVFCAYSLVVLFVLLVADRIIFQPPPSSYARGTLPFERIPLGVGDSIAVLHLPNTAARYTILYSHGNAEDLGHVLPVLKALRDMGFAVIGYDYRGYGESSPGPTTARRVVKDAEATYRYAVDALSIPPERLILYGMSIGSGPAVELAAAHQAAGLVLQSAFTSTFRVMTRVPVLPFDRFRNLKQLGDVACPVLVIHGTEDSLVPWAHGLRLFSEAPEPKQALWVEGAGHNDVLWLAGPRWDEALQRFVDLIEGRRTG